MKKFIPILLAALLALPVLAQQSAKERQQAIHYQRQVGVEVPGRNIDFPPSALRYQPSQSTIQHKHREKNTQVLKQQMDSCVYQQYNAPASTWINTTKNEFTYDGSGNNTTNILSYWNPATEDYEITGKDEFTYVNGYLTEQIHSDWDAVESMYVKVFQWVIAYNGDGDMTIGYTNVWNGSGWDVAAKDERTYDGDGNMVQQILSWWESAGNEWNNNYKTENSYDGTGALLVSTTSLWDSSGEGWLSSSENENTYNGSEQLIVATLYSWNAGSSQWVNSYKEEYTYDGNMDMVMFIASEWSENEWLYYYQIKMAYNDAYTSNEIILPRMFMGEDMLSVMPVHMFTGTTEYLYNGESFIQERRSRNEYSQVNLTAVAQYENGQALIYPQPSGDRVTFRWDINQPTLKLGIYDTHGKEILSQQVDNHGTVHVDHLAPGLYFYRLADNHTTRLTGKLSVW